MRKTKRQIELEEEYGMPFQEILEWYAKAGESRSTTAEILGYDANHFRRYVLPRLEAHYGPVPWPSRGKCNAVLEAAYARRAA